MSAYGIWTIIVIMIFVGICPEVFAGASSPQPADPWILSPRLSETTIADTLHRSEAPARSTPRRSCLEAIGEAMKHEIYLEWAL